DISSCGSEREANPDLMGALADQIGDGSIDSQSCEEEGREGEYEEHVHGESSLGERSGDDIGERGGTEDRKLRIDGLHLRAHLCGYGARVQPAAQENRQLVFLRLIQAEVDLRGTCLFQ